MAQGQTKGKYWLANNPNAQITNAEVAALGDQSETELDLLDGAAAGTVAASKAVVYSSAGGVAGYSTVEAIAHAQGVATALPANGALLATAVPAIAPSNKSSSVAVCSPSAVTSALLISALGLLANQYLPLVCPCAISYLLILL